MHEPGDLTIRAADLETEIARLHTGSRTRADYSAGEWVRREHLVRSGRMLTIALINSRLEQLPVAERATLLERVARVAVEWLRGRSLLLPGTLVAVHLSREVDLKLVSWGWGVGGEAYYIDDSGRLTTQRPIALDDHEDAP